MCECDDCKIGCCCCCMPNCINMIRFMYSCSVCGLGLIFITCSATIMANFTNSIGEFNLLINNWKQEPIVDIEIQQPDTPCNEGQINEVFHYKWQGTRKGCYCEYPRIEISECCITKSSSYGQCETCFGRNIDSVNSREFTNFGVKTPNGIQPIKMCVKRLKGLSFANNCPKQPSCPNINEKACGGQDPKKLTLFCVPKDLPCPITQMYITTQAQNSKTNPNLQNMENKGLLGNSSYSLYIKREGKSPPMVEFRVTEGDGVCLNNDENNISADHYPYTLEYPRRFRCKQTDSRFIPSMEKGLDEYNFFLVNNALDLQTNILPEFKLSDKYFFMPYYRGYVAFGYECRSKIEWMVNNQQYLSKINTYLIYLTIICSLLGGYFLLFEFWFVWFYYTLDLKRYIYVGVIYALDQNIWSLSTAIIKFALMMAFAIIIGFSHYNFMVQQDILENLLNKDCFDQLTKNLLNNLYNSMDTHLINVILYFWLTYWIIEPNMLYFWFNFNKYVKKYCQRSQKYELNENNNKNNNHLNVVVKNENKDQIK